MAFDAMGDLEVVQLPWSAVQKAQELGALRPAVLLASLGPQAEGSRLAWLYE